MNGLDFIPIHNWIFWRGFLLASFGWLCILNLSLWYWRRKLRELGALVRPLIETAESAAPPDIELLMPEEVHPAAHFALAWVKQYLREEGAGAVRWNNAFAKAGDSGGRIGDVCGSTLRRVMARKPVSERELLGLAWMLRDLETQSKVN